MSNKRRRPGSPADETGSADDGSVGFPAMIQARLAKRRKTATGYSAPAACACAASITTATATAAAAAGPDFISGLSDELVLRILGNLSLSSLLAMAPVSRHFHRLAHDSQLWKQLFYSRFVVPRAMRKPPAERRYLRKAEQPRILRARPEQGGRTDWRRQYRLRHNWERGQCVVGELRLSGRHSENPFESRLGVGVGDGGGKGGSDGSNDDDGGGSGSGGHKMLVKVVDGTAVTADRRWGLRVWRLRTRTLVARAGLDRRKRTRKPPDPDHLRGDSETLHETGDAADDDAEAVPTSLAVEPAPPVGLDIAIGFRDGSFDIWRLDETASRLVQRFSHVASRNGPLLGIAYSYPFLLTVTESVLVSLYTFASLTATADMANNADITATTPAPLRAPVLLTSLRSHTSRPPLALSIRKLASVTVASIAYTFSTLQGWCIGIQDLHIKSPSQHSPSVSTLHTTPLLPEIVATRLAYSPPIKSGTAWAASRLDTVAPSMWTAPAADHGSPRPLRPTRSAGGHHESLVAHGGNVYGPLTLSYTHPYLLATLPDNTLVLYLCTSNASKLDISPGIRLWGHTSGISDAEITSRGKAVSVSARGDEMRVWELEGRPAAERGRSVTIQPASLLGRPGGREGKEGHSGDDSDESADLAESTENPPRPLSDMELTKARAGDDKRHWVGFDDEMVIVLKQSCSGDESLMVYDFT